MPSRVGRSSSRSRRTYVRRPRKTIRKVYRKPRRLYRKKRSSFSNTTLKAILELDRILEVRAAWNVGDQDQGRTVINYNNTVTGITSDTDNYFDMTQTSRWGEYKDRYRKIKVHGVSVQYTPYKGNYEVEYREQNYATWESVSALP